MNSPRVPPPHRPIIISITSRSILLSWVSPLISDQDDDISYKIFIREDNNEEVEEIDTGVNETVFMVTDLKPFTTYSFSVALHINDESSPPSQESLPAQTHRERPGDKPRFIKEKIFTRSTSIDLFWLPPDQENINGEFLGFILKYKLVENEDWTILEIKDQSFKQHNITLFGLQMESEYELKLAAVNYLGPGPEALLTVRTEDGVPAAPDNVTISNITSTSLIISWHHPANIDTLPRDHLQYKVSYRDINTDNKNLTRVDVRPGDTMIKIRLEPATEYEMYVWGQVIDKTGSLSDRQLVSTDTTASSHPVIQNISCSGDD